MLFLFLWKRQGPQSLVMKQKLCLGKEVRIGPWARDWGSLNLSLLLCVIGSHCLSSRMVTNTVANKLTRCPALPLSGLLICWPLFPGAPQWISAVALTSNECFLSIPYPVFSRSPSVCFFHPHIFLPQHLWTMLESWVPIITP